MTRLRIRTHVGTTFCQSITSWVFIQKLHAELSFTVFTIFREETLVAHHAPGEAAPAGCWHFPLSRMASQSSPAWQELKGTLVPPWPALGKAGCHGSSTTPEGFQTVGAQGHPSSLSLLCHSPSSLPLVCDSSRSELPYLLDYNLLNSKQVLKKCKYKSDRFTEIRRFVFKRN